MFPRTVCVTRVWTECGFALGTEKKLKVRKMLENTAESHTSGARFVSCRLRFEDISLG